MIKIELLQVETQKGCFALFSMPAVLFSFLTPSHLSQSV